MTTLFEHPEAAVLHAGYRSDPATGAATLGHHFANSRRAANTERKP